MSEIAPFFQPGENLHGASPSGTPSISSRSFPEAFQRYSSISESVGDERGTGAPRTSHPFKVYRTINGGGTPVVKVVAQSKLWNPLATSESAITIASLTAEFTPVSGEGLYLHGEVAAGVVTSVTLEQLTDDSVVLEFDASDPFGQLDFWFPVAVFGAIPSDVGTPGFRFSDSIFVYQRAFTNLRLVTHCTEDGSAVYPLPA